MRSASGTLKLELAQYREVEAFAQFGSDLDTATKEQLANGDRQTEMLKQGQYSPLSMDEQVVAIYAAMPQRDRPSWIRPLELEDIVRFEREMLDYIRNSHGDILKVIHDTGKLDDDVEAKLASALDAFKDIFQPTGGGGSRAA